MTDAQTHSGTSQPVGDDAPSCAGCGDTLRRGAPRFVFDDERYHLDCVPAEHAARAQGLLGVKSC